MPTDLRFSMNLADARRILGFPPGSNPTADEIQRAWKTLAFKMHPDRGGDETRMVELNVAKDVLNGKQRPTPTYERSERPESSERPAGRQEVTWEQAKAQAGIPGGVRWVMVTAPAHSGYSSDEHMRSVTGYVLYGRTDRADVFVGVEHLEKEDYYVGAGPGIDMWSIRSVDYPFGREGQMDAGEMTRVIQRMYKQFGWASLKWNQKVMNVPDGWVLAPRLPHGQRETNLKHWLVNQGLVGENDPSVAGRKNTVELVFYQGFDEDVKITLIINGREYSLSPADSLRWVTPSLWRGPISFVFGMSVYNGSKKNLTRLAQPKRQKIFQWMSQRLSDLPAAAKAVIDAEAGRGGPGV